MFPIYHVLTLVVEYYQEEPYLHRLRCQIMFSGSTLTVPIPLVFHHILHTSRVVVLLRHFLWYHLLLDHWTKCQHLLMMRRSVVFNVFKVIFYHHHSHNQYNQDMFGKDNHILVCKEFHDMNVPHQYVYCHDCNRMSISRKTLLMRRWGDYHQALLLQLLDNLHLMTHLL